MNVKSSEAVYVPPKTVNEDAATEVEGTEMEADWLIQKAMEEEQKTKRKGQRTEIEFKEVKEFIGFRCEGVC